MTDLNKYLIDIATTSLKDHILWQINHDNDTWDTPESKSEYATIKADKKAAIDAYSAAGGLVTNRSFIGYHGGDAISHYDIDDAIIKKFGKDRVCADSESGQFFAYTDVSIADELDSFLKDKFPGLDYEVHKVDEPTPLATGNNWGSAARFLKEAGVKVDYNPVIPIPLKSREEIIEHMKEARQHLLLTGLFSNDEITNMLIEANKKVDGVK